MVQQQDIQDFLKIHRAKITPEMAGLKVYGPRRVKGLRREEVAMLAGISVDYYKRIERGRAGVLSESVIEGLVHALHLDSAASAYLRQLLHAAESRRGESTESRAQAEIRPSLTRLLDTMTQPAYLRNNRFDILATNELARALYSPIYDYDPSPTPNIARFLFLAPQAPEFYLEYEKTRFEFAAVLRSEAGKALNDPALQGLIEELKATSQAFCEAWEVFDISYHCPGPKLLGHPVTGPLRLDFEVLELPNDAGLRINTYTCRPGSPEADLLRLLEDRASA